MAWQFVFSNPAVPIWVEESALKALSATSHGQLAVGINGINSAGRRPAQIVSVCLCGTSRGWPANGCQVR